MQGQALQQQPQPRLSPAYCEPRAGWVHYRSRQSDEDEPLHCLTEAESDMVRLIMLASWSGSEFK